MEDKELSVDYVEGFNKGYILREHKPNLAQNIIQIKFPESEQEFSSGFKDGVWQREQEFTREKLAKELRNDQDRDKSRGK